MKHITNVTKLQLNKPMVAFGVPLFVVLATSLISVLIVIAIQRAGGDPQSAEYIEGARWNQSLLWALPGFLVYFGVQAVSTTFPLALVLGATRRSFVLGTALSNLLQSVYITVLMLILLGLEKATNHWGMGIYVFDVVLIGDGKPVAFGLTLLIGTFLMLTIGGFFGSVWVRFGPKGPVLLGVGLGLLLAVSIVIIAPYFGEIFVHVTRTRVAIGATLAALIMVLATWGTMRRASVRY